MNAKVYWIHLRDHFDPTKEGYVGVSTEPERRCKNHLRNLREGTHENIHLTHAYLLYKGRVYTDVIFEGTEEECYNEELRLRPRRAIGWNIAEGGNKPPSPHGIPKSESHRRNIGKANSGNKRPDLVEYNRTRKGVPLSAKHKEKLSLSSPKKRAPRSEATKEKLRAATLMQWKRDRDKLCASMKGTHLGNQNARKKG